MKKIRLVQTCTCVYFELVEDGKTAKKSNLFLRFSH